MINTHTRYYAATGKDKQVELPHLSGGGEDDTCPRETSEEFSWGTVVPATDPASVPEPLRFLNIST